MSRFLMTALAAAMMTGCVPVRHNLPPAQQLMEPGPGVGGPGPGVLEPPAVAVGAGMMPGMGGGAVPCGYPGGAGPVGAGVMGMGMPANLASVQVAFTQPEGMQLRYDATGSGMFDSEPLIVPARQNFPQGGLFRLKLTNIEGREGVELYPTVEIACGTPRTGAYLAHNAIPIQFTPDDLDQVLTGNFVTKVIYLPDPEFQGPAIAGIDTVVSTRLDPGLDPIVEADRRGTILAIIRVGNKDIEMGAEAGVGGAPMGLAPGMAPMMTGMPIPMGPCVTEGCMAGPGGGSPYPPALPGQVAGVTAPAYGMPMSGTPIGLPGPPHIPLGSPAGLQKHVIKNHTAVHIPQPVESVKIGVRQQPGYSYPTPPSRVHITEQNLNPGYPYGRPMQDRMSQPVY